MSEIKDLFGEVQKPEFKGWQNVETVTESELFGDVIGDEPAPAFQSDYVADNHATEPDQPAPEVDVTLGNFIPSPLVVGIMDSVIPGIMVWVGRKYMNVNFRKSELQATAMERKLLEPAVQTYLDSVSMKMSPLEQLLIAITGIYGGKMLTAEPTPIAKGKKTAPSKETETAPIMGDEQFNDMAVTAPPKKRTGRPRKSEM